MNLHISFSCCDHTVSKLFSLWYVGYLRDDLCGFCSCSRLTIRSYSLACCPDFNKPPQLSGFVSLHFLDLYVSFPATCYMVCWKVKYNPCSHSTCRQCVNVADEEAKIARSSEIDFRRWARRTSGRIAALSIISSALHALVRDRRVIIDLSSSWRH